MSSGHDWAPIVLSKLWFLTQTYSPMSWAGGWSKSRYKPMPPRKGVILLGCRPDEVCGDVSRRRVHRSLTKCGGGHPKIREVRGLASWVVGGDHWVGGGQFLGQHRLWPQGLEIPWGENIWPFREVDDPYQGVQRLLSARVSFGYCWMFDLESQKGSDGSWDTPPAKESSGEGLSEEEEEESEMSPLQMQGRWKEPVELSHFFLCF